MRAPIQQTHRPDTLPASGQKRASKAHRGGGAARCPAPAVPTRVAVDLALRACADPLRRDGALTRVQTAQQHDAPTVSRLPAGPGIGHIVRVVWLSERQESTRVPRLQDGVTSAAWAHVPGIRGAAGGHLRRAERPCVSHVGLLRSGGPVPAHPSCGPQVSGPRGENTRPGEGVDGRGADAGPGGLCQAQTRHGVREAKGPQRVRARSGGSSRQGWNLAGASPAVTNAQMRTRSDTTSRRG